MTIIIFILSGLLIKIIKHCHSLIKIFLSENHLTFTHFYFTFSVKKDLLFLFLLFIVDRKY